jgi:thymidylate synthase
MNKLDLDYQNLLKDILENGVKKETRNGGTTSVFGRQIRHNMKDGFPLLTTKKMPFKTIVTELLWFLRGNTNIKYLVDNNCHIWNGDAYKNYRNNCKPERGNEPDWMQPEIDFQYLTQEEFINKIKTDDEFANKWGELGKIYGKQWRSWGKLTEPTITYNLGNAEKLMNGIDQIQNLINDLKTNPDSRRLMVNAWNVGELDSMVLPPCHYGFQVYTRELSLEERMGGSQEKVLEFYNTITDNEIETYELKDGMDIDMTSLLNNRNIPTRAISLMWNQRSVDTFLGLPFNIASYGLLLEIIAKEVNMVPDQLIGNLGDVHLYSNHIEQAKEQIGRELTLDERFELWDNKENEYVMDTYNKLTSDSRKHVFLSDRHQGSVKERTREPYPLPTFDCPAIDEITHTTFDELVFKLQPEDFYMDDYQSHPTIKAPLSN